MILKPIAYYKSELNNKFGVPRQSGIITELQGQIVFEPEYKNQNYIRGLEEFDFMWLIWGFSDNRHKLSGSTVRPPRLGGNRRVGVFASRSPYRPNPIGLSSVKINFFENTKNNGIIIHVLGADLINETPIFDIKPYLEFTDSHTHIRNGYVDSTTWPILKIVFSNIANTKYTNEEKNLITKILEQDPRPHYHDDPSKTYTMSIGNNDIHFKIEGDCCYIID